MIDFSKIKITYSYIGDPSPDTITLAKLHCFPPDAKDVLERCDLDCKEKDIKKVWCETITGVVKDRFLSDARFAINDPSINLHISGEDLIEFMAEIED